MSKDKMKKIILILMLSICLISFVSAEPVFGTFKQGSAGKCIELVQTCGSCTYNNLSKVVRTGEDTIVYTINAKMTRDNTYYNYSFCNITEVGLYNVHGFGNPDGVKTSWVYNFEITPSGKSFSEGESLAGFGIIIAALVIAFFFMFFGFKLSDNEKLFPLTILFILISFVFIIYSLHLSYAYTVDVFQYQSLGDVTSVIYTSILWLLVSVAVISVFLILISSIKELGNIAKRKKYGDDFNPVTDSYDM